MLNPDILISPIFSLDALLIAGEDKHFDVYFHHGSGSTQIGSGSLFPQTIYTLPTPPALVQHATQQFSKISSSVDISFDIVDDPTLSDISFYYDTEINLGASSGTTFGVTISNSTLYPRRQWIEIFLNGPQLDTSSSDFVSYVFNHELLHALGLEHTFDDSDGDFYLSTDPLLSASPEETVMSYRRPASGLYPTDLTQSDYNALLEIWGPQKNNNSHLKDEQPVYRLFNIVSGNHLFTINPVEIDLLTGSESNSSFVNEGIAYTLSVGANQDLYRFYHSPTDRHFYSSNSYERDLLISNSDSGYIYEGVAYQVFTEFYLRCFIPSFSLLILNEMSTCILLPIKKNYGNLMA